MHDVTPSANRRGLNLLLAATTLLSAWLLFQVQPMVAKRILPWFGGGAAVWTTAILFFQAALFFGYLYAHLVARELPPRRQLLVHAFLLTLAAALAIFLGVLPADVWKPQSAARPTAAILLMLAACVGLPYLMLAATAPLVQVWFARANPGQSPYRLYAISNFGSLAALLSYPMLVEPRFGLAQQGGVWSALFVSFAVLCILGGLLSLSSEPRGLPPRSESAPDTPPNADYANTSPRYFFWLALPACASVLLIVITAHISQNVAPIPLLWILPMVAYLFSFILTFDSDRWYIRPFWMPLAAILSFLAVFTWHMDDTPQIWWMVGLHVLLLLAAGMVCHGELARLRPPVNRLTSYYLCIAGGGALGGLFAGIVAPLLFTGNYELHIGLFLAWLLALGVLVTDRRSPFYDGGKGPAFAGLLATIALLLALAVALGAHVRVQRAGSIDAARNFYGSLTVRQRNAPDLCYELSHGHISHGAQFINPVNRRVPALYFHNESGVGKAFLELKSNPPRRVGVVGLGVGTLATYAESGDSFQFYEINPQVIAFAEKYFTYLADAHERGADVSIHEGDARLVLERQSPQNFDLLVLDAFNGDAVPVHLLTLEAIEAYLSHLSDDGILVVHASNLYIDLEAVIKAAAARFNLDAARYYTGADVVPGALPANWIFLHRRPGYFAEQEFGAPLDAQSRATEPWTDDYSNVLGILKR